MTARRRVQILLLCVCTLSLRVAAQNPEALSISPGKATMLVGETRTFRAVGKDGRIRHNVHWSVSPEQAAEIRVSGDEVTVAAHEASPSVSLTAYAEGDSADASIEIRPAGDMPAGTPIWSVSPTPGCKATKMTQAVPTPNGPDLYVQEDCPQGSMIRALTSDGRELWRRMLGGPGQAEAVPIASGPYIGFIPNGASSPAKTSGRAAKSEEHGGEEAGDEGSGTERINVHAKSVCDAIAVGMPRDDAAKAANDHNVAIDARQRTSDTWTIEEEGFRCTISFDAKTGNVVKKNKIVVTD